MPVIPIKPLLKYSSLEAWLTDFNMYKRANIQKLERIINACPDKDSNEYHLATGVLQGRKAACYINQSYTPKKNNVVILNKNDD